MTDISIKLRHVSLNIRVFMPGQQRLIRKSNLVPKIGGRIETANGKVRVSALRDVSLELGERDNLALIGPNGAGKTTLLKVIAGIYPPSDGVVEVKGALGCLLEIGLGMSDDMTGAECVKHQCVVFEHEFEQWRDIAAEVAEFTELGPYMDMPIRTYSSGMRARLAAALATAWHRDILLIDEGIGAGDAAFHDRFAARLKKFMEKTRLMVMASHDAKLLKKYCKTGLVMQNGGVLFAGPLAEALDYYRSLDG